MERKERIHGLLEELNNVDFQLQRINTLAIWASNKNVEVDLTIQVTDLDYEPPQHSEGDVFDGLFSSIDRALMGVHDNRGNKKHQDSYEVFDEFIDASMLLSMLSVMTEKYMAERKKLIGRLKYYGVKI